MDSSAVLRKNNRRFEAWKGRIIGKRRSIDRLYWPSSGERKRRDEGKINALAGIINLGARLADSP